MPDARSLVSFFTIELGFRPVGGPPREDWDWGLFGDVLDGKRAGICQEVLSPSGSGSLVVASAPGSGSPVLRVGYLGVFAPPGSPAAWRASQETLDACELLVGLVLHSATDARAWACAALEAVTLGRQGGPGGGARMALAGPDWGVAVSRPGPSLLSVVLLVGGTGPGDLAWGPELL